ncbi:MAG: SNF2-related protein [Bacteroidota bacterium]
MPHWFSDYRPAPAARAGAYRRKYGTTWWGKQFLEALERADNTGRLSRGKTYANKGLVLNIQSSGPGRLTAEIQGSRSRPYRISMDWTPWSAAQAQTILQAIQQNPALRARLLAGDLPNSLLTILEAHNLSIFPINFRDLGLNCNCPDYAMPCKHQAALLYVIAADIDGDPFQLLKLRGLDLQKALQAAGEAAATVIPTIDSLLQDITPAPTYRWDEATFQHLHFNGLTDAGWRAVAQLPPTPPFAGDGELTPFLEKIYAKAARAAAQRYPKGNRQAIVVHTLPPGGRLELHLDQQLGLHHLTSYNDTDEPLLTIEDEPALLAWLGRLETIDRHLLDAEARTLLLFFQLARRSAEVRAYVPEIIAQPAEKYLLRYVPATNEPAAKDLLDAVYTLASPVLLYGENSAGETQEFIPEEAPRTLLSFLIGLLVKQGLSGQLTADAPARCLFLLDQPQQFSLVGTAGFPAAMQRWLAELHLAERDYQPVFRIEEDDEELLVDVLVNERARTQVPSKFVDWQSTPTGQGPAGTEVLTLLGSLARHFPDLERYLAAAGAKPLRYTVAAFTPMLLAVLPAMEALGLQVLLPTPLRKLLRPRLGLRADSQESADASERSGILSLAGLLTFDWQASLGDQYLTEDEFRALLNQADGLVKLKEGYAFVDPAEVAKLLAQLNAGPPVLKPHERLHAVFTEEHDGQPVRLSPRLRRQIEAIRQAKPTPVPSGIRATLRPYQEVGYDWLYNNSRLGFGSVIADDMGLGKTLQVITLLERFREDGALAKEKALVIVPTSLLSNWQREIERFAPDLHSARYHGPNRQLPPNDDFDVLLTTYGIARSETKTFASCQWKILIIDEAQAIKNPAAKQTKAIKKLKAPIRIAMSGTPVENRMLDYWSLLDFTLPKFLGSKAYFQEHYARPIQGKRDQVVADRFRRLTAPFVLRRLKTDKSIITDLPEKVVQTETCSLTPEQAAVYQSIIDENLHQATQAEGIARQGLVLKLITALKQCCNHPVQFLQRGTPSFAASGKAALLQERLSAILAAGDKTLIFTQYRTMGELLGQMIKDTFGIEAPFLHGGCSPKLREELVDRFQHDPACPIFLLSIKAAGTGLNLTAANHVIHYDLWWNPAVENQATDRAYRIGQDRTVFVHRLVTENTFEEKIDALIQGKRDLAELSVGTGERFLGRMTNEELGELVRL